MIQSSKEIGNQGEEIAASFLNDNAFEIIERNYRGARGEIDIIALKDGVLVFVEVKTARGNLFGAPETWVDERKQEQIGMVAERYLQEHEVEYMECRFDVIAIQLKGKKHELRHIENAFWL